MGYAITQNQTAQPLVFFMVLSSDHITGATGLTPTVTISKNGGAFAAPSGAISSVGNGWYQVAGNASDSNTLGPLLLHATAGTADPVDDCFPVVAYNPQSANNFITGTNGVTQTYDANNFLKVDLEDIHAVAVNSASAQLGVNVVQWNTSAVTVDANSLPNVNAKAVNAVLTTSVTTVNANVGTTQPTNFTGVGASALVKSDAVDIGGVASASGAIGSVGSVTGNVGGNVTGSVGSVLAAVTVGGYSAGQDPAVRKNQALNNFAFLMVSSTDHVTPKTGLGAAVTAQRSLDGAAFAACANAVAELSNGIYVINLAAGDLNAGVVTLRFSGTGADDTFVNIVTQP